MAKPSINLLPTSETQKNKVNPYVEWFFRSGIYVLLITYTIVLAAFGYRWYQEYRLSQVKESIVNNVEYIASQQETMSDFARLKSQYSAVDSVVSGYDSMYPYLLVVQETIPHPIVLDRLQISNRLMTIEGVSNDYVAINQWEADLKKRPEVALVTLASVARIESTETTGVDFSFTVTLK